MPGDPDFLDVMRRRGRAVDTLSEALAHMPTRQVIAVLTAWIDIEHLEKGAVPTICGRPAVDLPSIEGDDR
jgi:hypothetical protein